MMTSIKVRNLNRALSVLLAILMVFTMIPSNTLTSVAASLRAVYIEELGNTDSDSITVSGNEAGGAVSGNESGSVSGNEGGTVSGGDSNEDNRQPAVLSFEHDTLKIYYGTTAANVATDEKGNFANSYESSDPQIAEVDEEGNITPTGIGTVIITATINETEEYLGATATYELTVDYGEHVIKFPQESYEIVNGETFEIPELKVESGPKEGKVVFLVEDNSNEIVKSINEDTGEIEFTFKTGQATIKATRSADNYNVAETTYILTVKDWNPVKDHYKLTGETKNESGWFTGDVSIEADEGYLISLNQINGEADWKEKIENVVVADAKENDIKFFVKEKDTGRISKLYEEKVKKDAVKPNASITIGKKTIWDRFWEQFTGEYVKFTISSDDQVSGVASVQYYVDNENKGPKNDEDLDKVEDWKNYQNEGTVSGDDNTVIYAKITDTAGNYIYVSSSAPIITIDGITSDSEVGYIDNEIYYKDDVTIPFSVKENSGYGISKIQYKVTLGENDDKDEQWNLLFDANDANSSDDLIREWNSTEQGKDIVVDSASSNSDNVMVTICAIDNKGNETEKVVNLKICTIPPTVSIDFRDDPDFVNTLDGVNYYDQSRKAEITITSRESLFDSKNVDINVSAIDVTGKDLTESGVYSLSEEWIPKKDEKNPDKTTYTKTITFSGNAIYDFSVIYTDRIGQEANASVEAFVIDDKGPEIELSFNKDVSAIKIDAKDTEDERGYYNTGRKAVFTITDSVSNFSEKEAKDSILKSITATDSEGKTIDLQLIWNETDDKSIHEATVDFFEEGIYTIDKDSIEFEDYAKVSSESVTVSEETETPYKFTVDWSDPHVAKVTLREGENIYEWNEFLESLTFNSGKEEVSVSATAEDKLSKTDIYYFISDSKEALTEEELESSGIIWTEYDLKNPVIISENTLAAVYFKIVDYAGNDIYRNSNGYIVDSNPSMVKLDAPETGITHNNVQVYNDDVMVSISVSDGDAGGTESGISKVEYKIVCDDNDSQSWISLYDFNVETGLEDESYPSYDQIKHVMNLENAIEVRAKENNSCNVVVKVKVTDRAGNQTSEEIRLDIDDTAPEISVSYGGETPYKIVEERGYYPDTRTATVTITERTGHFNADNATADIKIAAVHANGDEIVLKDENGNEKKFNPEDLISEWRPTEGETPDEDTHEATISYSEDANYTFAISYTDLAGNVAGKETISGETPYEFTVDGNMPTGTLKVDKFTNTWDELIETLTFGLWSNDSVKVIATATDLTSPIESVHYYKTDRTTAITETELKSGVLLDSSEELEKTEIEWLESLSENEWLESKDITVDPNEQFTVYMRIVDYAGRTTYISTDGVIVEKLEPEISISLPPSTSGIYNSNVRVNINVVDPGDVYSGIKEIGYKVYNMGDLTQSDVLFKFAVSEDEQITYDKIEEVKNKSASFDVLKDKNNSNDVRIEVYAIDNAGNQYSKSANIKIDATNPTITVSYDNNDGDISWGDTVYFKANRTATISVKERNFNAENVLLTITNEHGVVPGISAWSLTNSGSGNGDDVVHTATVIFSEDGDYTFDISCTDQVGNKNEAVNYGNNLAPQKFTIDKILPVINVTYDNVNDLNGNYYNNDRVATVSITEHNFETSRIQVSITANDNVKTISIPTVSGWTTHGDVHTATIHYSADALYTFDIDYTDKAGNIAADFAEQSFYIDKTKPAVYISQIVDESANNAEGNIGFVITATDTNFDVFTPVITVVVKNGDKYETKQLQVGEMSNIANGKVYTVSNLETDGIYRIGCTVVDKAGNEYAEVTLENKNGTPFVVERSGNETLVTFSVNRDGSTYEIDNETAGIINKYYVQNVSSDLSIIEINANALIEYKVTLNGQELTEGVDYQVTEEGGNGVWFKYTYVIKKELFENEGEYQLVVSSKDQAGNDAFSDVKDASLNFVVDRTSPVVTVTGLATNGRYQIDKQIVTLVPTDDGGALRTLIVRLVDENGSVIKELINLSGEALTEALEAGSGMITFEIEEGLYQNVQIICDDYAVDEDENTNVYDDTFKDVSVSSSSFMIYWANKPLRYGSIAGVSGFALAIILFILFKKRKKETISNK